MFKGAYSDHFYRTVRDALHAEVESWHRAAIKLGDRNGVQELWRAVETLEPVSRNLDATELPPQNVAGYEFSVLPERTQLVYLQTNALRGDINE
jgi:hypothetical protein